FSGLRVGGDRDGGGCGGCAGCRPSGLCGLKRGGGALRHRSAESGGVDCAVGLRDDRADLGEGCVVKGDRFALCRDAMEDAVGLAAGEYSAVTVESEASDMRLAGFVIALALPRRRHAKDPAFVTCTYVERSIWRNGQRPYVQRSGREVLGRLALLDTVDFAVGRRTSI